MLISVVIAVGDRPVGLERCLTALAAQDFDGQCYEVIVAGARNDRVAALAQKWNRRTRGLPRVRHVGLSASHGIVGARNVGWRSARGEVLAFTDPVAVPNADWLTEGWRAMQPDVVAAAGRVRSAAAAVEPEDRKGDDVDGAEFTTANCFVTRQALRAVGGFDERFTSGWREDSDLLFMLLKVHGRVGAAPHAIVNKPAQPATWIERVSAYRNLLFEALLYKKHPELYRERVDSSTPWHYYGIAASIAGTVIGAMLGSPLLVVTGFGIWLALTAVHFGLRWTHAPRAHRRVGEIAADAFAIPLVAAFWRLVGALRFRVRFF
ncbi:MAG: glycosyltransferase [Bacillota bacterium]